MRQARHLGDAAGSIEFVEAGIAVGVHPAVVAGQMAGGMLALSINGEPVPGGRYVLIPVRSPLPIQATQRLFAL